MMRMGMGLNFKVLVKWVVLKKKFRKFRRGKIINNDILNSQ